MWNFKMIWQLRHMLWINEINEIWYDGSQTDFLCYNNPEVWCRWNKNVWYHTTMSENPCFSPSWWRIEIPFTLVTQTTSIHGNALLFAGPLWGESRGECESTVPHGISLERTVMPNFGPIFVLSLTSCWTNSHCQWFEILWCSCDVIVMENPLF